MATINKASIMQKIANSVSIESEMHKRIYARFQESKDKLIEEFESHPVTLEIKGGIDAINSSGTLGGYGNLFTYIGFPDGSDPTEIVKEILESEIVLFKVNKSVVGERVKYQYRVIIPEKTLRDETSMPFETGNSWLYDIETGISGFSNYVYGRFKSPDPSRSGGGIQSKYPHLGATFIPVPYIRDLISKFTERVGAR